MTEQQKNKLISAVCTAVIMALVVLVCCLLGMYEPDPPIPDAGVEVNLGDSDFGLGDDVKLYELETMPETSSSSSTEENVITQNHEQTTSVPNTSDKPKVDTKKPNPEAPKTDKPKEDQPQTNNNALFRKKNPNQGGSEGTTQGTGNQGKQGGDPNSSRYDGAPGNGGSGWSLTGRGNIAMPKPPSSNRREGKIIVKIYVDRKGNVTKAEAPVKGSTITDGGMVEEAKTTALKAKFTPSDSAPETQTGTITYVYTMQ